MKIRGSFAGFVAASVGSATGAMAADLPSIKGPIAPAPVAENPWLFSIEGGAAFSQYSRNSMAFDTYYNDNKLGRPGSNVGAYGSISLGRKINADWDWRLTASGLNFPKKSSSIYFSDDTGSLFYGASNVFSNANVDLDVGRTWRMDRSSFRLFGGLRGSYLHDSSSKLGSETQTRKLGSSRVTEGVQYSSSFLGLGPRIGFDGSYALDERGNFSIVGGGAASLLWGERQTKFALTFSETPVPISENGYFDFRTYTSKLQTVGNLNGFIGLSFVPVKNTTFTIGYKLDYWMNALPKTYGDAALGLYLPNTKTKNVLTQIPFARLDVKF